MQLTKERAITLHRRMWRWIGLKTLKEKRCVRKEEWFKRFKLNKICLDCYCCEYDLLYLIEFNSGGDCAACPIDWGGKGRCYDEKALLALWKEATWFQNDEKAGKLALQIAELPERKSMT